MMEDRTKTSKRIGGSVEVEAAPPRMTLPTKRTKYSPPPQLKELKKSHSTGNSTTNDLVVKTTSFSFLSDELSTTPFPNYESLELVKDSAVWADLEEVENGAASAYKRSNGREAPFSGDSEQKLYMDSPDKIPPPDSHPRNSSVAEQMPSSAEIEEFFSDAERRQQAKFTEKYNFDVEKEVALEGRYQWERVEP